MQVKVKDWTSRYFQRAAMENEKDQDTKEEEKNKTKHNKTRDTRSYK